MKKTLFYLFLILCMTACTPKPENAAQSTSLPPLYPDYTEITIPCNIAPLNFLLREGYDAMEVRLKAGDEEWITYAGDAVRFNLHRWHQWLETHKGEQTTVQVTARKEGKWTAFRPFHWNIAPEPVDRYLSYRLIEPGYEVWEHIQLCERDLERFDERVMLDNKQTNRSCMNCHTYGNQSGDLSFFHLRGGKGGTILNRDGKLRKLNLKADGLISGCVYGAFHPSGRYGVFSTNTIIPAFHSMNSRRLEVYDTESDVVVVDFDHNKILTTPLLSDSLHFETFPTFSADGKSIYFCTARAMQALPDSVQHLKYSLCRIGFDAEGGTFGTQVDTLWNAREQGRSVCHPKASPDGRFLMYSVADYGTFPIWHREADLELMELSSGKTDAMEAANSNRSESYHSWSSNSRWAVFASKRDDGVYGKPYLCYIDARGKVHKAFCIPLQSPKQYDETLKSYNIPELSRTPARLMNHRSLQRMHDEVECETFTR